jgi:malonate-semialdehyde dehydrogenase (acetylating)/methylmalonate-semialdehyde dehydrogenase
MTVQDGDPTTVVQPGEGTTPVPTSLNYIDNEFVEPSTGEFMDVECPGTGEMIGTVAISGAADVDAAVAAAKAAHPAWAGMTSKGRAAIMMKWHHLIDENIEELSELVILENGKNKTEAVGDVAKGNETVEWACSMPQLMQGRTLEVSAGVVCQDVRDSLGVVACIVPFNFPAMVPLWTTPIALGAGNCVILKPSEKVPMTMHRIVKLWARAGGPPGVLQVVNGTVPVVESLCDHPDVAAVTFVGSSRVAEIVAQRCRAINKRVLALGGAKNHLVALPDCDQEMVVNDILTSAFGSAGQRCMAASALVLVGDTGELLQSICTAASQLQPGSGVGEIGPIIDSTGGDRIMRYINEAEAAGTQVLLDGRAWLTEGVGEGGCFIGPTILLHSSAEDAAMQDEIFGPVLSVICVATADEALGTCR